MLCVEDYNTAQLNYINEYYRLDTSKIGTGEFENVIYDFIVVSHSINENNKHTFIFKIENDLWTGGYWYERNGSYVAGDSTVSFDSETKTITIADISYSSIVLNLYLCSFTHWNNTDKRFMFHRLTHKMGDNYNYVEHITYDRINHTKTINLIKLSTGARETTQITIHNQVINVNNHFCMLILFNKLPLVCYPELSNVTAGIINYNVRLRVSFNYLPDGNYSGHQTFNNIKILYGDNIISVRYDATIHDYVYDLDLTGKTDNDPIKITVLFPGSRYIDGINKTVELTCNYPQATNYAELNNLILNGSKIIQLTEDIFFDGNILLNNDVHILGSNKNVYLNGNTIYVNNNISANIDNVAFNGGSNCLKQLENNKLVLNNCSFNNCAINDREKGSVLVNTETSVTEINNCKFNECPHTIYNAGDLTVTNSEAVYTETANIDPDYSMFINSYAGDVEITHSKFKIRIETDELCSNEVDMRFAQSIIGIGANAIINGVYGNRLRENNSLPLFDSPFNNQSHIYAKYYYPEIDDCVIINPELSYEQRSACHRVIGTDWVYKNHCKLNPANSNDVNTLGGD